MKEKKFAFWWLPLCFLLGSMTAVVFMTLSQRVRPAPIVIEPPPPTLSPSATPTPGPIRVYVSGEVAVADVYELPAGSIVADAVEVAGDFTEEAAADLVNLAQPLVDGMHVHVPDVGAAEVESEWSIITTPASSISSSGRAGGGGERLNINTASLDELDALPGIGPVTAQKIVDYREANGPFEHVEEIMEVSGIGEAKFEQMEGLVTVD